jgi:hypothetical protein
VIHWNHRFQQLLKVVIRMKSTAMIDRARDVLLGCLKEVPFVTVRLVMREATNQLARFREQWPDAYGVVMAPYISPKAAVICREEGA